MKRKHYLLILLMLSVNLWYIKPFGFFLASNYGLAVYLIILFTGIIYFFQKNKHPVILLRHQYLKPLIWIYIGVLLSFIPAYINYKQGFGTSFIASRVMLTYLTLPALFIIKPTYKDIRWSLYMFSAIYFLVAVCDSFLRMPIIAQIEGITYKKDSDYIEEKEYIHFLEGIHYVGLAFITSLNRLRENFSIRKMCTSLVLIGIMFLVQNRSTLFSCILFYILTLFFIKQRKYRNIIRGVLVLAITTLITYTFQELRSLFAETSQQIGNVDYNRNIAISYFIYEACPHWWEYIIGNGFISAKSATLMQDMMEQGVYNSDVGFIGLWNQFGLIPIIVYVIIIFTVLAHKKYSFYIKCNAWFIIACSLTTAYFAQNCKIVWICLFLYMYSVEDFFYKKVRILKINAGEIYHNCNQ